MDNTNIYLSGYGIRPSVQRIAIMRYLLKNFTHPTADDVFEALKKNMPTLSKTTVYNTLKLFVEHGAAIFVGIDEKNARFDGTVKPHAHFRCKECGCILDISVNADVFVPKGFEGTIDESYLYFKGVCEQCNSKKPHLFEKKALNG